MVRACLDWQVGGLAAPERVLQATRQLFDDLDPIGRFAKECLAEDPGFLSTGDLAIAYSRFLADHGMEVDVNKQEIITRLKGLSGVKQVARVGTDGARHRGLTGRKLA